MSRIARDHEAHQHVLTMRRAWHQSADSPNIFPDGVPFTAIEDALSWRALSAPVFARVPATIDDMTGIGPDGKPYKFIEVPNKQAVYHSDTEEVFEVHSGRYAIHQHDVSVVDNVRKILDGAGELIVGSFGQLDGGATAWLSIEMRDTIKNNDTGVEFLPRLLAIGSHNGKHATTYRQSITNVVCRNTMAMALREKTDAQFKIKHSSRSEVRVSQAREALQLLDVTGQAFWQTSTEAVQTSVTDAQWIAFLEEIAPVRTAPKDTTVRTANFNERKQAELQSLWRNDLRVSPWQNTAWGAVMAVNTWEQWNKNVKGGTGSADEKRDERNMARTVAGDFDTLDRATLSTLDKILANA